MRGLVWKRSYTTAFKNLGISDKVVESLQISFPKIRQPTPVQSAIVSSILSTNRNIVIQDWTGSGKSFITLLSILSAQENYLTDTSTTRPFPQFLLITPSNTLAHQYAHWISLLSNPSPNKSFITTFDSSINKCPADTVQFLIRDALDTNPLSRVQRVLSNPPHLLIATPQRLNDLLIRPPQLKKRDLQRFQDNKNIPPYLLPEQTPSTRETNTLREMVTRIPTIVLEEADSLLDVDHPKFYNFRMFKKYSQKHRNTVSLRIIDKLVQTRAVLFDDIDKDTTLTSKYPRLICLSATANESLLKFISHTSEWMRRGETLDWINGSSADPAATARSLSKNQHIPPSITHSLALVLPNQQIPMDMYSHMVYIFRQEQAKESKTTGDFVEQEVKERDQQAKEYNSQEEHNEEEDVASPSHAVEEELLPLDKDVQMLYALVFTFAAEGCRRGLLFVPDDVSVERVVEKFQEIDAPVFRFNPNLSPLHHDHPDGSTENIAIYATHLKDTRGLDLSSLTHVFIPFPPPDAAAYKHMAGRVSRFGGGEDGQTRNQGKVVTLIRPHEADPKYDRGDTGVKVIPPSGDGKPVLYKFPVPFLKAIRKAGITVDNVAPIDYDSLNEEQE